MVKTTDRDNQFVTHLNQLQAIELSLAAAWQSIAERHGRNFEVQEAGRRFSLWSSSHADGLAAEIERRGGTLMGVEHPLRRELLKGVRLGSAGLVNDLQDVNTLLQRAHMSHLILGQAAKSLRDSEMSSRLDEFEKKNHAQITWCVTQVKSLAPQVLVVPS